MGALSPAAEGNASLTRADFEGAAPYDVCCDAKIRALTFVAAAVSLKEQLPRSTFCKATQIVVSSPSVFSFAPVTMPPPFLGMLGRTTSSDGVPRRGRPFAPQPSRLSPHTPPRRMQLRKRDTAPQVPTIASLAAMPVENVIADLPSKAQWIEEHELIDALEDDAASDITVVPEFTALDLSDSGFNCIPIGLFAEADCFLQIQTLNLSNNPFDSSLDLYITETLVLPQLTSLYLRSCNLSHIDPLVRHLRAPNLKELDMSTHQFTGLVPDFRRHFPRLESLLACKGSFDRVEAISLKGLRLLDLKENLVKDHDGKLRGLSARMGTRILL